MNTQQEQAAEFAAELAGRRDMDRQDEAAERELADYEELRKDMVVALTYAPEFLVLTPGFGRVTHMPAHDVVLDNFSGTDGTEDLRRAMEIIGMAARGADAKEAAKAWIAKQAEQYATFHNGE
jgi:hypothetical protein